MKFLIIDAGNTRIKVAYFHEEIIFNFKSFKLEDLNEVFEFINQNQHDYAILSSVLTDEDSNQIENRILNCKNFKNLKIPIENKYKTPKTLGADRLANAVAILKKVKGNRLAIDLGTCIKFDFVDKNDCYLGGSISPGLSMRFQALNHYTGKLPQLEFQPNFNFLGLDTKTSIYAGVSYGIQMEINGFISKYEANYDRLTIFVTGGDHLNFDYSAKNNIFADENLTLFGLLQILKANVK